MKVPLKTRSPGPRSGRLLLATFLLLTAGACGLPCGPATCAGCCDAAGACIEFPRASACGASGAACVGCGAGALCVDGACNTSGLGGGAGGGAGAALVSEALAAHNQARATASPTPVPALRALTWNPAAAAVAQGWAERCTFDHHEGRGPLGENLYASTAATSISQAVAGWASEGSLFELSSNTCRGICGHYTQLVWRDTTSVGCGTARCTTGSPFGAGAWTFWVCNYAPPGNVVGEKPS